MKHISLADALSAILGEFSPANMGSRLFMERSELETPDKFLVWFHERFHYLQTVFTPYGHLKWGSYRTLSADIVEAWANLSVCLKQPKKLPIREYLLDDTPDSVKLAYNIWFNDSLYDIYRIMEQGTTTYDNMSLFGGLTYETCCPIITLHGQNYRLKGIDIFESFAKFEEAMLGALITDKTMDDFIDPNKLNPEYYSALYYFVEKVGLERLNEFPVVCELALAIAHIPSPTSQESFRRYAPNWRFVEIVEKIQTIESIPSIDFYDDNTFVDYANTVLSACGYEILDKAWLGAEKYAQQSDLTMAEEMKSAIEYKKAHPWMLSYPMRDILEFLSEEFNRFKPYYTIMEDGVGFNSSYISFDELILENHIQALAKQICGYSSRYSCDSFKLMCGYSYMGINTCPHYLNGECEGYIDHETELPKLIMDDNSNIKSGCTFEVWLKIHDIDIKDINIGFMRLVTYDEIMDSIKKHFGRTMSAIETPRFSRQIKACQPRFRNLST